MNADTSMIESELARIVGSRRQIGKLAGGPRIKEIRVERPTGEAWLCTPGSNGTWSCSKIR